MVNGFRDKLRFGRGRKVWTFLEGRVELRDLPQLARELERDLGHALRTNGSQERFERVEEDLNHLVGLSRASIPALEQLRESVHALHDDWVTERRYTNQGLSRLEQQLRDAFEREPMMAARQWLEEILDAIRAAEWAAAARLADGSFEFADELAGGAATVRTGLARWREGNDQAGVSLMTTLGKGTLRGWEAVLKPEVRTRACRLAAWICLRRLNDAEAAAEHLANAIALDPQEGVNYAERAAYYLFLEQLDSASADARRAIEHAPDDAAGYLHLGAWAEGTGLFADAEQLYRDALARLRPPAIAQIQQRASLVDPSGGLLLLAAEERLTAGRLELALQTVDAALAKGVRGSDPHPDAAAFELKSRIYEQREGFGRPAAEAAVEAAKRYLWNDDPSRAQALLERTINVDGSETESGWLLADVTMASAFPPGTSEPDQQKVDAAKAIWDRTSAKFGSPTSNLSWAFLTRAIIADSEAYEAGADRQQSSGEALFYTERAIVQGELDAQRWGLAGRYLRLLNYDQLAYEAVIRAQALDPLERTGLNELLALLAMFGHFEEASDVARRLTETYGEDPWVNGVRAWLALENEEYLQALEYLALPLARTYDLGWYLGLRALCNLAIGRINAARDDYRAVIERTAAVAGYHKSHLAIANALLGDLGSAEHWAQQARADPTIRPADALEALAYVELLKEDHRQAAELLREAISKTTNITELDTLVRYFPLRLGALDRDAQTVRSLQDLARRVLVAADQERRLSLREHPRTPEIEVDDALSRDTSGELWRLAFLAVQSRRHKDAADFAAASESYERLQGTAFEPEATIALTRTLTLASAVAASEGDVETVESTQAELLRLGGTNPTWAAINIAACLDTAGRIPEARERLEEALGEVVDPRDGAEILRRLGDLAIIQGTSEVARNYFGRALETAQRADDLANVAQLHTRLALIDLADEDFAHAGTNVQAAISAWQGVGHYEPAWAVWQEVHTLLSAHPGAWTVDAPDTLTKTVAALAEQAGLDLNVARFERFERAAHRPTEKRERDQLTDQFEHPA
jgi:tetratricopeptide (TPR) repeat protein